MLIVRNPHSETQHRSPWLKMDTICAQPSLGKEAYVLIAETLHYWNYSNQWMNKMASYNWIWWKRWWISNQFRLLHIIDCAITSIITIKSRLWQLWLSSNLIPRRQYVDPRTWNFNSTQSWYFHSNKFNDKTWPFCSCEVIEPGAFSIPQTKNFKLE